MQPSWFKNAAPIAAALFCGGNLIATAVLAHPHVWVTVETEVVFDEHKAITGFRHKWTFDEAYSAFAVEGRDSNNDGNYDREELKELTEVNISSLKEFHYFTYPRQSGRVLDQLPPRDSWLEFQDGKLKLFFTLPLAKPVMPAAIQAFSFAVYDSTFYVDFALAKDKPITLSGAPAGCVAEIKAPVGQSPGQSLLNSEPAAEDAAAQYANSVHISCRAS
jgi:ABC-type uncharacterized transport system substrate-binding protein